MEPSAAWIEISWHNRRENFLKYNGRTSAWTKCVVQIHPGVGMDGGILASLGTSDRLGRVIDRSLIETVSRPSAFQAHRSVATTGLAVTKVSHWGHNGYGQRHKRTIYVQSRRELRDNLLQKSTTERAHS